ncbi:hypothetical protein EZS27_013217 [termite gut metagenome]|uniref:Uncharacterized protein n=1 Tax=termite gut metagenome TaxID=433724 RepID=A0A5J4RZV9_9ZZZZ
MATKIERLEEFLMEYCYFEKDIYNDEHSLSRQYVHLFIQKDGTFICKYVPPHNIKVSKWTTNINNKDFGIRLYSTVFFSRIDFNIYTFSIMKYLLQLKYADGRIDLLENTFSRSPCKSVKIKVLKEKYDSGKKRFLNVVNAIVNDVTGYNLVTRLVDADEIF